MADPGKPPIAAGGERVSSARPEGRRTLILGGARSGKSTEAERRLARRPDVVYVATGGYDESDPEWTERVDRHRARRPASWTTLETLDLEPLLDETGPPLLIDCLTLWLSRVMDEHGVWTDPGRTNQVEARMTRLTEAWSATRRTVVAVSNEVGSGVVPATVSGRLFRDLLGVLNTGVAATSDEVLLCVVGRAIRI
jgi:adenosylcobinamide kinase / adenosylcobinamide-phosphate guanylyltransferase